MGKWLAALGAVLLVVLILLWRQLDSSSAAPPAPPVERPKPAEPVASVPSTPEEDPKGKPVEPAGPPPSVVMTKSAESGEKWDPQSDEFFHKHDEIVVPQLMRSAVKCWENLPAGKRAEFHRNQSMTAKFKQKIRNGVVTIYDVEVERSSINDPALEACFLTQIRGTTWTNSRLPDWDQDDQIKLGPRTLKKYTRENIEYEGPEGPRP
jgi:hypothetical protein